MKLSQILGSRCIHPDGEEDGGGSWGIFVSPDNSGFVVKLFYDEQQFTDEKTGYDSVLNEQNLKRFANPYSTITVNFDTCKYSVRRKYPPFRNALLIPFLSNPPWQIVGKLGNEKTDEELVKNGINVKGMKDNFEKVGLAWWESTFFVHSNSEKIKAIDFTFSELVYNNYIDPKE